MPRGSISQRLVSKQIGWLSFGSLGRNGSTSIGKHAGEAANLPLVLKLKALWLSQ